MSRTISSEKLTPLSDLKSKGSIAACLIGMGGRERTLHAWSEAI
jgi:hypothetical protein